MSSSKSVRVSYLEHNKILEIPPRTDDATTDLEVLEREFRREFLADQATDLKLTVTFQKFDPEWEEYIDINSDAALNHKDKLKAIISTANPLSSSARIPSSSESGSSSDEELNNPSSHTKHPSTLESEDEGEKTNSSPAAASTPCRKKRRIQKTGNDSVPLSDPFILPKHYHADVETALKLGKMTRRSTRKLNRMIRWCQI